MSWDNNSQISCTGFSELLLPALKQAISGGMVQWGRSTGFCGVFSTEFTFADCKWSIEELNEYVTGLILVSGHVDPTAVTAALLKGRINTA